MKKYFAMMAVVSAMFVGGCANTEDTTAPPANGTANEAEVVEEEVVETPAETPAE